MLSNKILKQLINKRINTISLINKGWSDDEKFIITTDNHQYLIRRSNIIVYEKKIVEFEYMKKVFETGINMQEPLMLIKDEEYVYILLPYIKGRELEICLPEMDEKTQYAYGYKSGDMLKKMHSIKTKKDIIPWYEHFSKKVIRNIKRYKECGVSIKNGAIIIKFLLDNMNILKDRPQAFMHGDYHVGNMLVDDNDNLAIIDFNRMDFGDPYEEFNRLIAFTKSASISFANGQINGYFNNNVPEEFFVYLAFYTASNTIGSIPWAISFGQREIDVMRNIAQTVLKDFNNFTSTIPIWYKAP